MAVIENMGIYVGIFLEADQNVRTWFWKNRDIAAFMVQCSDKSFQMVALGDICVYQTHHSTDYLSRIITELVSSVIGNIMRFSD